MDAKELFAKLKDFQEKKGYFFNHDEKMVMDLLEMLLVNKERYGHMACPCRLASGDFEMDKDIVCPCAYREKDVAEYGTCFCGLYVSKEWNEGRLPLRVVPERRPPEKVLAGLGLD
jgi:ferredoxin-thioredoxin reductase catalytic chain